MQVLVVEDEPKMAALLRQGLTEEGYVVTLSANGAEAFELALGYAFDAMVLDVMLPGMDGFAITRRLRERHNQTPILILTARDAPSDIVSGLDLGADDYLTKPFSFDVLLARLRALGRRVQVAESTALRVADLTLDTATREVKRASKQLRLTRTEFSILELFMKNAGRVVTRESIIEQVWSDNSEIESNTLDVFVRLLRAKVEPEGEPKLIHTVRGVGYTLKAGGPL